jgi:hypothetical protein
MFNLFSAQLSQPDEMLVFPDNLLVFQVPS